MKLVMITLTLLMSFASIVNAGSCSPVFTPWSAITDADVRYEKINTGGETYYYIIVKRGPGAMSHQLGWNGYRTYHVHGQAQVVPTGFTTFGSDLESFVYYYTATDFSNFERVYIRSAGQWGDDYHVQGDGTHLNYFIREWGVRSKSGFQTIGTLQLNMRAVCNPH